MDILEQLLDLMERVSYIKRRNIRETYMDQFGQQIVPYIVRRFHLSKKADFRADLLSFLIRYAKTNNEVLDLAIEALADRSQAVRHNACAILAYSGNRKCLDHLKGILQHKSEKTSTDAHRAMQAIIENDHNLFYPDYDQWGVSQDDPQQPKKETVDYFIIKLNSDLVEPLQKILGDLYSRKVN